MRRNWRSNPFLFFIVSLFMCSCLILTSLSGLLTSAEGLAATPLYFVSDFFSDASEQLNDAVEDLQQIQTLRERNAELEEALARSQAELVRLREIESDYRRIAALVDYTNAFDTQETVTAEVIGYDPNALLRTIIINVGSRNGITTDMPVVTQQGLIGRVIKVTDNASQVLLIIDPNSNVSSRLQTTRAQGTIEGLLAGNLRMRLIPLDADVQVGDIVLTSGLGGNFPADVPIGQITSRRQFESELYQTAEVRSFVDFDRLEFVLVVTNFQPVDLSVFEDDEE